MKSINYNGRVCRPTMKTHAGVKERTEILNLQQIQNHCDAFLRGRGQRVGMMRMTYGKEEG